eukprot:CAMPEP_0175982782 /NCGR_PEP_ID=MMETSP0108-20121206/48096_1 /TAXON_ID=195067 ORGANISM="Goniomonas pacifica, Strain CCMP1869" /NCGR_SAMPLE_ID=MMETSP0108 /ASSEMBLY_ACC=CAM_ASM_000204 /LENGTH=76 /DNA_ID=CAMNT_0017313489 /DNA_START=152 /DNA_END=383 /DNA_ORIENTATION=+
MSPESVRHMSYTSSDTVSETNSADRVSRSKRQTPSSRGKNTSPLPSTAILNSVSNNLGVEQAAQALVTVAQAGARV